MDEKKGRPQGRREKTDGGIKLGALHRWDGWMGDFVEDGKSLCPSFFLLPLMTWQQICSVCLLLLRPCTQVVSTRSNPTQFLFAPRIQWHVARTYGSWLSTRRAETSGGWYCMEEMLERAIKSILKFRVSRNSKPGRNYFWKQTQPIVWLLYHNSMKKNYRYCIRDGAGDEASQSSCSVMSTV